MESEKTINTRYRDFSKEFDVFQTILIYLISLLTPIFLGKILNVIFGETSAIATNSQIIVGSIVNTALIVTALNLKGTLKITGIVTMPSIATILSGYIFHTASIFMVYMIPAIWIGNFALIYTLKKLFVTKKSNYFLSSIVGIALKVAIIFGAFSLLKIVGIFPEKIIGNLQNAMGITQIITATIGSVLTYILCIVGKKIIKY